MAETIFQRRKIPTVISDPNPLIILLTLSLLQACWSQVTNRASHFVPQIEDMSQFTLSEDTSVGTPVYHSKDKGIANTEPNAVSLRRVIPVKDVNDNTPIFHTSYSRPNIVNISEATAVGTEIERTARKERAPPRRPPPRTLLPPFYNIKLFKIYKVSDLESVKYLEQIVTVKAHDADAVLTEEDKVKGYSDIGYTLRGENSDLFKIDNVTGSIQVAKNKTLDRERQSVLRLEIEAADTPSGEADKLKTIATNLVNVLDVDDNSLEFEKNVYTGIFTIDAATDGGGHSRDTSLYLYIDDVSANDGVPRFIRPAAGEILSISENATIGSAVYQVVASDPDDPTQPSGQLFYSIQPSNDDAKIFSIDPHSGQITTRHSLDREQTASYTLVLLVTDRGQPPQQSTKIVTVKVTDVDDHKPHFGRNSDDPPVLMTVKEEVPIGTVIGQLEAIDEDIDENAAVDYAITEGNNHGLLKLERTNDSKALITTAARLDRVAVPNLLITIKCFKYGTTPRPISKKKRKRKDPSEIQVLIKVLDIDGHLPKFESADMKVGVRLNVPIDTLIASFKAIDKDPDARPIHYSIVKMSFESPIKGKSLNNITDVIVLNNVTGDLKIMKNLTHYADGIFRLVVRRNNTNDPKRFGDILVEVVVVRERDLFRLVMPGGTKEMYGDLRDRMSAALAQKGLKMQLHDVNTAFYANLGPCFQFWKEKSGKALTPKAMKKAIRDLDTEFQEILKNFNVDITRCGVSRTKHSPEQNTLLALAGVLPLVAFIAALVLCCMHSGAKKRAWEAQRSTR